MGTTYKLEWEDHLQNDILMAKCTDQHLFKAAEMIVSWEPVARSLGFTEAKIVEIQKDHMGNYHEQKYQFLIRWKSKFGSQATYHVLLQCLNECEMRGCAEDIIDMIKKGYLQVDKL